MALSKSFEVVWGDIFYAPIIYYAVGDVSLFNQFAQPSSRFWVILVVICSQWQILSFLV
jgi:hypothetical protein